MSSSNIAASSLSPKAQVKTVAKSKRYDPTLNQVLSEQSIRYNDYLLDYCQTSMSALSGCAAGILGMTGLYGFLFYFICSLFLSVLILLYLGPSSKKYFISKQTIVTGTLWSGIQTYLLFWTFMFGMVHVYWAKSLLFNLIFSNWKFSKLKQNNYLIFFSYFRDVIVFCFKYHLHSSFPNKFLKFCFNLVNFL